MKRILCYGDSNTWGDISHAVPPTGELQSFDEETRWACVLQSDLGTADWRVYEQGLCGRTTVYVSEDEPWKSGEPYLKPCLLSIRHLDLVILMLGTNDLRVRFGVTEKTLGDGVARLIDIVRETPNCGSGNKAPQILVIAPIPMLKPTGRQDFYQDRGCERGVALSRKFAETYRRVAEEKGCLFMDAGEYGHAGEADGLHMTAETHRALGRAVAKRVRELFG